MGRNQDPTKGFGFIAPCGVIVPKERVFMGIPNVLTLEFNKDTRQRSTLEHMIWGVPENFFYLSNMFPLKPRDLIMEVTPSGVNKINEGDFINITLWRLTSYEFYIGSPGI